MSTLVTPAGFDDARRAFIEAFYAASDERETIDKYLLFLTPTVVLRMGLATFTGHEAVRQMRIAMWSGVATRKHTPRQVFVHSKDEIMLYGEVEYGLENGKIVVVDFGARMQFQDDKLSLYQVYLDTTNLKSALAS